MMPIRFLTAAALLGLLSACATDGALRELREVSPRGTPYAIALTQEYLQFSEAEAKSYDWADSAYFAEKGLEVGYGREVTPEGLENWQIDESIKPEVIAARQKLTESLTESARTHHPKQAAAAVAAFDCWLEELEEGWNAGAISDCQERFYTNLAALEFDLAAIPFGAEASGVAATSSTQPFASDSSAAVETTNLAYLIYFRHDSAAFDSAAQQVVRQILAQRDPLSAEPILIHGHTDRSGSEGYNLRLSEQRAITVMQALIESGIPASLLQYYAFGETDPKIPTADGIREPQNRRVEIFLG